QIFPHSRASRQVHTFSMSIGPLITKPARKEVSPACTIPLSKGGDQSELSTWSRSRYRRACFIVSHPAAFDSRACVSSKGIAAGLGATRLAVRGWGRRSRETLLGRLLESLFATRPTPGEKPLECRTRSGLTHARKPRDQRGALLHLRN